jgi:hypothetical protein
MFRKGPEDGDATWKPARGVAPRCNGHATQHFCETDGGLGQPPLAWSSAVDCCCAEAVVTLPGSLPAPAQRRQGRAHRGAGTRSVRAEMLPKLIGPTSSQREVHRTPCLNPRPLTASQAELGA